MKYIIFLFLISTASIVVPNMLKPTMQDSAGSKANTTKLSPKTDSSWFDKNLDIFIEPDYFSFDPVNYTHKLTPEAKTELSLECWLGKFTISNMVKGKDFLKIDFSNEEITKIMFITKTFFVLTSYINSENGMSYGSSLLYNPQKNTLKELESIIVFDINKNTLECSKEHFSEVEGYVIEHGHYNIDDDNFIVEFTE
jgi:hypothetical protein